MKLRIFGVSLFFWFVFVSCAHSNPDFMVYNGKTLAVSDIKQITNSSEGDVINGSISPDGDHIAYILKNSKPSERKQLIISKIPDLNKKVLLDASVDDVKNESDKWILSDSRKNFEWSPNGKYLVVIAKKSSLVDNSIISLDGMLIFTSGGILRTSFILPENMSIYEDYSMESKFWNSRSNMIAFGAAVIDNENNKELYKIGIANLTTNKIQFLDIESESKIELVGWSEFDGLQYTRINKETRTSDLYETNPKNGKETLVQKKYRYFVFSLVSSDKTYKISDNLHSVTNTQTG